MHSSNLHNLGLCPAYHKPFMLSESTNTYRYSNSTICKKDGHSSARHHESQLLNGLEFLYTLTAATVIINIICFPPHSQKQILTGLHLQQLLVLRHQKHHGYLSSAALHCLRPHIVQKPPSVLLRESFQCV